MACRSFAGLLGGHRPVLGLEAAPRRTAGMRVGDVAAAQVDLLRSIRADGPYLLGGWSFGAIVAHEIARQLGDGSVAHLLCLDGHVRDTRGRPLATEPSFLVGTLRLRAEAMLGRGRVGGRAARTPELRDRLAVNLRALLRYRPGPVATTASVLRTGIDGARAARLAAHLAPIYRNGVRVLPVAGDHRSMLEPPHVRRLAELASAELAAAETNARV